jgi:hypothetical protein
MAFYHSQPFDTATAKYVWHPKDLHGFFYVLVDGNAPNFTFGVTLIRDPHYIGGLVVDVMGWTGPLSAGTSPYKARGLFPGFSYLKEILVIGANKREVVPVEEVKLQNEQEYIAHIKSLA